MAGRVSRGPGRHGGGMCRRRIRGQPGACRERLRDAAEARSPQVLLHRRRTPAGSRAPRGGADAPDGHGRGALHPEVCGAGRAGALIEAAIREAKDRLFRDGQTDATLADGMVEVANRSLGAIESSSRVDKFRIYVHLDTEGGWISRGGRLPKHMVDRLTCDGVLQPVWETEGHPVNVGRASGSCRAEPDASSGPRPRLPIPRLLHERWARRGPPHQALARRRGEQHLGARLPLRLPSRRSPSG